MSRGTPLDLKGAGCHTKRHGDVKRVAKRGQREREREKKYLGIWTHDL